MQSPSSVSTARGLGAARLPFAGRVSDRRRLPGKSPALRSPLSRWPLKVRTPLSLPLRQKKRWPSRQLLQPRPCNGWWAQHPSLNTSKLFGANGSWCSQHELQPTRKPPRQIRCKGSPWFQWGQQDSQRKAPQLNALLLTLELRTQFKPETPVRRVCRHCTVLLNWGYGSNNRNGLATACAPLQAPLAGPRRRTLGRNKVHPTAELSERCWTSVRAT
jgi:hypothetical protein